ncbi:MAG: hypothetical protein ACYCYN_12585, partial [Solirubrobacteraceae bacterium]
SGGAGKPSGGGGGAGSEGSGGPGGAAPSEQVTIYDAKVTLQRAAAAGQSGAAPAQSGAVSSGQQASPSTGQASPSTGQASPSTGQAGGGPGIFGQLSSLTPLPGASEKLIAYAGARSHGQGALVLLVKPAIVHGQGRCLPSDAACEAIYFKPGQQEYLQYLQVAGETAVYTITLHDLRKRTEPAAQARAADAKLLPRERTQLERLGIALPPGVRFSTGVEGMLEGVAGALQSAQKAAQREKHQRKSTARG